MKHYSYRTEQTYIHWIKRYLAFHGMKHPVELGPEHITAFVSHLAEGRRVSASTQNQALAAVLFLYKHVLKLPAVVREEEIVRAKRPSHVPTVLSVQEVTAVLNRLKGRNYLMGALLYGAGLRLNEMPAPTGERRRLRLQADYRS
jgi:site-specific recombinase XerD